ncbi:MAG: hypothetical protein AUI36_18870 [Cyanobacteria bacterium 13_1_40CM_2_61_4]|nr:MAG: hypothetical protein AUI36_18870 [Cyanobacteria bacterium 13_1_40CM_2_61_4]
MTSEVLADADVHRLVDLRLGLLRLHEALLEVERKSFERTHGRVTSGELLQLVINHEQFAWLRMVSALVLQIDEMLDADEPVTHADVSNLIERARQLFTESEDLEFQQKYQAALEQEPEVVMAHSALMKLLRSKL